jgi:hypothetical protein
MLTNEELGKMIDEPMPSTNVKKFFEEVKEEAHAAAVEIAETKKAITDPVVSEEAEAAADPSIQAEIDAQAAKYMKLREMAEEFQLTEEQQEVARFERENDQLNLDLEKLVEAGASVGEITEMQYQAREDSLAIHNDKMAAIEGTSQSNAKNNMEKDFNDTLAIAAAQNKDAFELQKGMNLAKATVALPSAVLQSFENGGGYPWGIAPAVLMAARGALEIQSIASTTYTGQAHSGMDNVPADASFNLRQGEMVLDPGTSDAVRRQVTGGGGPTSGTVIIESLNVTVNAIMDIAGIDWEKTAEQKMYPAFKNLFRRDIFLPGVAT